MNFLSDGELIATVDRGACSLLARTLDGQRLDNAISDVRAQVLTAINQQKISNAGRLPDFVRNIVKLHGSAKVQAKAPVDAQGAQKIQAALNAEELEVLHRYYVLGESTTKIGQEVGLSADQIKAVKQRARRAFKQPAGTLTTTIQ